MKNNQPVTQREYVLEDGVVIISHTDRKGRITHCNDAFVEASGFTKEELLGKPHNLVRHPDVPAEAFRDLWQTIGEGLPWEGIVKNRRKNGDHYWVKATATPLPDGSGYMSVRFKPTREEIAAAEAAYALLHSKRLRLFRGMPQSLGLRGAIARRVSNAGLRTRVMVPVVLMGLAIALLTLNRMDNLREEVMIGQGHAGALNLVETARSIRRFSSREDAARPIADTLLRSLNAIQNDGATLRIIGAAETSLDGFEREARAFLAANPTQPFARIEYPGDGPVYRLAVADGGSRENRDLLSAAIPLRTTADYFESALRHTLVTQLGGTVAVMFVLWLGLTVVRRRVERLGKVAEKLSKSDFTGSCLDGNQDEVGMMAAAFGIVRNRTIEQLATLRDGLRQLKQAAHALNEASRSSATRSEHQSGAASTIAAALEELSESIRTVEGNAAETQNIATETGVATRSAADAVHAAATEIADIARAVNQAAGGLDELESITGDIGKIVDSIHDIADQTNLLALNAAIEAARAGEQGRGFAVVADEVRNLASRTTAATAEIGNMVTRIQSRTGETVGEMRRGIAMVGDGVNSAHTAGDQVAALDVKARSMEDSVHLIYDILKHQAATAAEIAHNVDGVASKAMENLSTASEIADATDGLETMTDQLSRLVRGIKV